QSCKIRIFHRYGPVRTTVSIHQISTRFCLKEYDLVSRPREQEQIRSTYRGSSTQAKLVPSYSFVFPFLCPPKTLTSFLINLCIAIHQERAPNRPADSRP